jgi:hypothetical protein
MVFIFPYIRYPVQQWDLLQKTKTVLELTAFARTGASAPVRYYEALS